MKFKSTLTIVAIAVLAFAMVFATSASQIDKIFATPVVGKNNDFDVSGDKPSDVFGSSSSNPSSSLFGQIFGNNNPSSSSSNPSSSLFGKLFGSQINPTSSDKPSSSTDPKDQPCIQSKGTGTKDYYCFGTHHHCEEGKSPGCVFEGGRA